ncbi:Hydroxyproline-rich glycoprotein family protein, putative, expressed [Heracleum sosnowskyi]|uniref:Protein RIK n=1 Tax=Heracleum sosnowskyi TaxID=360622 RepID=A0AAD8GYL2_9APIA|nr:Hydroxyproline-rich glycoprotein family protein, putative, expressed [Heracleum sosnowskyi]
MTQDDCPSTLSSSTKQRRKRKWDQPAESVISAVPGVLPLGNVGSFIGTTLQGVPATSAINNTLFTTATLQQVLTVPSLQQHAVALVQKINQTKLQEELIAREIVINDAESSIRNKLTKRQTQEEIQRCTGSVVITRGRYRPPNGPTDGEKPLYLHISAGAHLETTADRIKAVDQAAAMVDEMLKQGSLNSGTKPLSTHVYLGFEPDPSLNIAARIRGPNDQYVNHIMNETGATVLLRGRSSGNPESEQGEEGQQPLHLLLSSSNPKGLEHAKLLAENLLDTICSECGASRVSSCKVYGAVPPPPQLLPAIIPPTISTASSVPPVPASPSPTVPVGTTFLSQGTTPQPLSLMSCGQIQPSIGSYSQPSVSGGTSYNGYGGIYPQATPLQQVALALKHSASPVTSMVSPVPAVASTPSFSSTGFSSEKERRQRRKFQELPANSKGPAKLQQKMLQDSEFSKQRLLTNFDGRNVSNMPSPKKLTQQAANGLPTTPSKSMPPPPPPKSMLPPLKSMLPPPPRSTSSPIMNIPEDNHGQDKTTSKAVPDTLIQLMEYGDDDEDDDLEEITGNTLKANSNGQIASKPFWAV